MIASNKTGRQNWEGEVKILAGELELGNQVINRLPNYGYVDTAVCQASTLKITVSPEHRAKKQCDP